MPAGQVTTVTAPKGGGKGNTRDKPAACSHLLIPSQPPDLLVASFTPSHVMVVGDYAQAQGAIIGKAMSSLDQGQGLILVLVSLQ